MTPLHPAIAAVTDAIRVRSHRTRGDYLARIRSAAAARDGNGGAKRQKLGCANLAHSFAACAADDKQTAFGTSAANIAIVTAYNDMLSAHQPYEGFPEIIRSAARRLGAMAQVAGGVPAMCDGVTQGEAGMELSLFSRDVIALSTAVALSHQAFDAALYLGICDKIVPGLVIGALSFGHLPAIFVPSGPMTSGLPNDVKAQVRRDYAAGKVDRAALLASESKSYHGPGTCTFYGTANTNQMLMEIMGLHLPGASFVTPNTPLRQRLTEAAVEQVLNLAVAGDSFLPMGELLDERAFVNGLVGLSATGGSTNLTLHFVAMAAAAGIILTWEDFAEVAAVTPLLTRVYPNGKADVNGFHAAGGMGFVIDQLLEAGLLDGTARTVWGKSLSDYRAEPFLIEGRLEWRVIKPKSLDDGILRPASNPFQATGGLGLLRGNLGRAIVKTSAVVAESQSVTAEARVFSSQEEVQEAFTAGDLNRDVVVVVRFQGPRANGMPELHNLMPPLGVLQERGFKVALVTDGRLSGASGKVLSALHVTPEASPDSPLARLRDGDWLRVCGRSGRLDILTGGTVHAEAMKEADFMARPAATPELASHQIGVGRELFKVFRANASAADQGATLFDFG
ncbi:MAG: phosphogluconate dehydratase [Candidatus Pacebacteria bacterium]|nr:phosphogluconate dehydratase [Candidatus Paceibacterota bacterium]